jgi:PHD/YefM family antitoxin component YafN of YafNO toxin-antitoxin module
MSTPTQFLTDANGAKVAAVIPIDEYEELMEDLSDLAVVAERRDEPRVSFEEVKQELKEDGRLPS